MNQLNVGIYKILCGQHLIGIILFKDVFCFAFVCKLCVGEVSNYIVQPFHNPSSAIPNCGLAESCIGGCDFSKAKPPHSRPKGKFLLSHTRLPTLCEGILYQKHERFRVVRQNFPCGGRSRLVPGVILDAVKWLSG